MAGQFVFEARFHQRPKVCFALVSDFHGAGGEPDDGGVQLLVLALAGVLAEGLQEAMRGEFAHAAEGVLARQVRQCFPNAQILLVELLACEFDSDSFLAGKGGFLEKHPVFALDGGEQGGADKAVGCAALGLGP